MFFVAASPTMRKLRAQAELLAQLSAPVLILGENGSGKELAARLIHKLSVRSGFRFLKLNCATLPGRRAGERDSSEASNGSGRSKPGKLELCQRGTLFLDEITEMPMALQTKLLHVFATGILSRAGSELELRWMFASWPPPRSISNKPLPTGSCGKILYYRLSAFTVHVPALRQRKEEIPLLLAHFMNRLARRYSLPARIFSAAALDACQHHCWPGNLSELEKFVKRYLVMGDGELGLNAARSRQRHGFWNSYLPQNHEESRTDSWWKRQKRNRAIAGLKSLVQSVKGETERNAIAAALDQAGWNRKAAARLLKVSYRTLLYKIEQYRMSPPAAHLSRLRQGLRERSLFHKEVTSKALSPTRKAV